MSRTDRPITPLTSDQQALAARYVNLARRIAGRMTANIPWFRDDAEGAALEGLTRVAARFDPGRGFIPKTYLAHRIAGAVRDAMRESGLAGYKRNREHAPNISSLDDLCAETDAGDPMDWHDLIPDPDVEPPDAQAESADTIARLLCCLPPGHREPMTLLYTHADCALMKDAGREVGLSQSRISQIHSQSIEMIRQARGLANEPRLREEPSVNTTTNGTDHRGLAGDRIPDSTNRADIARSLPENNIRVLETAWAIADEGGPEPTVNVVAARLNLKPSSVYYHRDRLIQQEPSLWPWRMEREHRRETEDEPEPMTQASKPATKKVRPDLDRLDLGSVTARIRAARIPRETSAPEPPPAPASAIPAGIDWDTALAEAEAMRAVAQALQGLSSEAAVRVLRWAMDAARGGAT